VRTEARFPGVEMDVGHYESFYLKESAPEGGRAVWIRHTAHKRPNQEPTCAVWMTYFDATSGSPRAAKQQFGAERLGTPAGSYMRVDDSEIGPGYARGAVSAGDVHGAWTLRFNDRHEVLKHLPSEWMYRRSLPRTKLLSPHPGASFDGVLRIGKERVEISDWPGMVGHNWGAEHAEQWVWIQATAPEGAASDDYIDVGAGRIRVGRLTTPWIANGAIVLSGERHPLGGIGRTYSTEVAPTPTGCRFSFSGTGISVHGTVGAPAEQFVGFLYSDPSGGSHHALNCSISDLELRVERPDHEHVQLRSERGAVYELGTHDTGHGIPIQPYEDG